VPASRSVGDVRGGSGDPTDALIHELVRSGRAARPEEVRQIRERLATAPFNSQLIRVPTRERGLGYQGRVVQARDDSAFVHLVRRVVKEKQWADGTNVSEYLEDLHQVAGDPSSRIVLYDSGRGPVAGAFGPNTIPSERLGRHAELYVFMVYSVDRSSIITGYQVSDMSKVSIPTGAQWLT
jgi:hypothetical protein